jgi:hypothetical protein
MKASFSLAAIFLLFVGAAPLTIAQTAAATHYMLGNGALLALAGGGHDKKSDADVVPPELLNLATDPTLRYPVMRLSGLSMFSTTYGWLDVSKDQVRYTVVHPDSKAKEGFDIPLKYVFDPKVGGLSWAPGALHFFGYKLGDEKKQICFVYLPQKRWGHIHTTMSFTSAQRDYIRGTHLILVAMTNFESALDSVDPIWRARVGGAKGQD